MPTWFRCTSLLRFLREAKAGRSENAVQLGLPQPVPMDGLIASCVSKKKPISCTSLSKSSKHSDTVDLPWGELPSHIHTWPCFSGKVLSCVIQFRCVDPAGRPFGDDGAFNEYNPYHHNILRHLIICVMLHMNDRYPMMDRDAIELRPGKGLAWIEGKSPSRKTGGPAESDD